MAADRTVRVWEQIGRHSLGATVSMAHVCAAAVASTQVDGAAVVVMRSPTVRDTVHATNRVADELEEWQFTFGEGPCVDAFTAGGPMLAADLNSPDATANWPVFTPAALQSGAQAIFALPVQIGAIRLGVLDLYRARPGSLSSSELAHALAYAEAAGTLLLDEAAGTSPETPHLAEQREDPTADRAQVHQATGMILVQLGVSAEVAFARLRAYTYAHDRRLADVARDVIARRLRFGSDPSPGEDPEE